MDSLPDTRADGITNPEEATAHCVRFAQSLGYPYVLFGVRMPTRGRDTDIALTNFPKAWLLRFRERKTMCSEPLFLRMGNRIQPFSWDDLPASSLSLAPGAEPVPDFHTGWTVPFQFGNGYKANLSVAGESIPTTPEALDAQYMIGLLFAARMAERIKLLIDNARPAHRIEDLKPRERDVLELIAQGMPVKTAAYQLNMSKRAAEEHLRNAQVRLQVSSREQAIVRAVSIGAIGLVSFPAKVDLFDFTGAAA